MTLQELLKEFKNKTGLNNEAIAKALGISKSTVSRWSNGDTKNLKNETLEKFSNMLGVDVALALAEDTFLTKKPLLGIVKAGYDLLAEENIDGYIEVTKEDAKKGDYFLRVTGDSMDLAKIHDHDLLFVKQCNDVESGTIAIVMIQNEVTVKRVIKKNDMIILEAANPKYENRYFTLKEKEELPVNIIGRVIYSRSDF